MKIRVQFRRGSSTAWSATNVTLAAGEVGFETDTSKLKFGDGMTSWAELPYANLSSVGSVFSVNTGNGLLGGPIDTVGTISLDRNYVATLEDTQTISNKTFGSTLEYLTSISTDESTLTLDLSQGPDYYITINDNINNVEFINKPTFNQLAYYTIIIRNPAAYTFTWPSSVHWPNNTTPTLSTNNREDIYYLVTMDGGTTFYATTLGARYNNPNIPITQNAKLSQLGFMFGSTVAISEDGLYAAISTDYNQNALDLPVPSKIFIFHLTNGIWLLQATIYAPNLNAVRFGHTMALSLDGSLLVVGDPDDTADGIKAGTAYVYRREQEAWSLLTKLDPADPAAGKQYGMSVTMNENATTIFVGAPGSPGSGVVGSVYKFDLINNVWSETTKISQQANIQNTLFGYSIKTSALGDYIAIGAPSSNQAHIYNKVGSVWVRQFTLFPTNAPALSRFGTVVRLSGDGNFCLVSDPNGGIGGYVIAYGRSDTNWVQLQIILESHQNIGNRFGQSMDVSYDGIRCIICADGANQNTGRGYAFVRNGLAYDEDMVYGPSDAAAGIRFGYSSSMSSDGSTIITSAPDANAAYIFTK